MIIVTRGSEPPSLAASRSGRLPIAESLFHASGRVTDAILAMTGTGYQSIGVKEALFRAQHKKCAFCEIRCGFDENPIEHFRPRKLALRNLPNEPRDVDHERYWWLAWTWENLFFSCHRCNGRSKKGNYFPLEAQSAPLSQLSFQLACERPRLLDPSEPSLCVSQHLFWRPCDQAVHIARWSWRIEIRSVRGEATMAILELDYRADDVTDRYRQTVWPRFNSEVLGLLCNGQFREGHLAWGALCRGLLKPDNELTFATWCMLEFIRLHVPEAVNARLPLDPL